MPVRQMLHAIWVVVITAAVICSGCGDDSGTGPTEGEFILDPQTQWSGGVVEATSSLFSNATTWAVLVDGDTVNSWRIDAATIAFELPNPYLTGTATVDVEVSGAELRPSTVDVVGNAWAARTLMCSAVRPCDLPRLTTDRYYYHGVRLPAGQLLAFFDRVGGDHGGGVGVATLDGPEPVVSWLPDLSAADLPGLVAPGQAVGLGQWAFDVSQPGVAVQPTVWQVDQGSSPVRPLACLPTGIVGAYAVVELPTGDCLVLTDAGYLESGSLTLNGTTPVGGYAEIPWGWTAGCAGFASSPGNRWTTLRARRDSWFCDQGTPEGLSAWPVFDASGTLMFSSPRYPEWVRGADFTSGGDTLWVVGATPTWSLDAWNPATGELLSEMALDGLVRCEDVLLDPLRPYVYTACRREGSLHGWPSLVVVDRSNGSIVAVLDPLNLGQHLPFLSPIDLVYGGSSGRVHLTGVWDGTSAPVDRGVKVVSWDVQW